MRCTRVGGALKSAFAFRRTWKSIYILQRNLKTMLKPDWVNTSQFHWLLPWLFFSRTGNRLACSHLPKPVSVTEQQDPWVAAGQMRTGTLPTAPHPIADERSDQGRSGDGDQGQPRAQ